jgi:hypothetical protein
MSVFGGTTLKSVSAGCAQRSSWYRSALRLNSSLALIRHAPGWRRRRR